MSYDFGTQQICPHEVFFETLTLDPNAFNTLYFQRPPSNQNISLYVDGVLVPKTGLYSYAELPIIKTEPYRIESNVNDLLYIRIGFDAPRFVQLIPGSRVRAKDLAQDLQNKIPELSIYEQNKRIFFRSKNPTSGAAFSFPDPRWTDTTSSLISTARVLGAYSILGITPGRVITGRKIFPSWQLVMSPFTLDGKDRVIILEYPIPNDSPLFQASYVTDSVNCRRCHGSRIEFDYRVLDGQYEIVTDLDLLSQEFDKFVFTKIGSHFKWGWLGSAIVNRIGGKGNAGGVSMNSLIAMDINQAFQTYQNIKTQQDQRFRFQQISDAEFPYALAGINVEISPQDPTVAVVTSTIVSRSREPLTFKRIIGNPNPYSLQNDPIKNLRLDPRFNFLPRA